MFGKKDQKTRKDNMGFTQVYDEQLQRWIYPKDRWSLVKGIAEYVGLFGLLMFFILCLIMSIMWWGDCPTMLCDRVALLHLHWQEALAVMVLGLVSILLIEWSKT